MRAVFVKTVNEDQTPNLPKISAPTILFWGEKDTATPLVDGQVMAKKMRDAALIVKNGGTHYAFLEFLPDFLAITDSFLKPEKGLGNI
jgi:pimeloyl-ACP methyl ester carboxylesterase